jgi:hypothetical protein
MLRALRGSFSKDFAQRAKSVVLCGMRRAAPGCLCTHACQTLHKDAEASDWRPQAAEPQLWASRQADRPTAQSQDAGVLVIAGVIGSCSAEFVLPVLPVLPTHALVHKDMHGHGRQLQISPNTPGLAGCSDASKAAWVTCQNSTTFIPAGSSDCFKLEKLF